MKVLIVGSGGREHAVYMALRLIRFPQVSHSSSISVPLLRHNHLRKRRYPTASLTALLVMYRLVILV